jgi:hypothetical protein
VYETVPGAELGVLAGQNKVACSISLYIPFQTAQKSCRSMDALRQLWTSSYSPLPVVSVESAVLFAVEVSAALSAVLAVAARPMLETSGLSFS